jgi:methionine sulfoxide reductase heme-binding subunit
MAQALRHDGKSNLAVYIFWALLALPGIYMFVHRATGGRVSFVPLSGEIAGWLLIATLLVTPVLYLAGPIPWLKARRRNLGVAAFAYTCLHVLFWAVRLRGFHEFVATFTRWEILVGWIAGAIMLLLALTSNDLAVRRLGRKWKPLQRWVYAAAALAFLHWVSTTETPGWAILYASPVIVLSGWRIWRYRSRRSALP